ncbi:MAG: serine/threonine-protein kinase [Pseudomonadota bacterium]
MTEKNSTEDETEYQAPHAQTQVTTPNRTIGKYTIVAELGRGGMGVVYKAWEESLKRHVAIKMLGDQLAHDDVLVERFLREARAAADLNHPNIVQVFAVDTFAGQPYFAMEYVEGQSLKQLIRSTPDLPPARAAELIREAANGLAAAHAKELVHRDIKPDNIMVTNAGHVKVVDFGIAKVEGGDNTLTATGVMVGTPNYISPEVCLGQKVDARSDIFSLGIVFYEMLAGRTPFQASSPIEMMSAVVQAEVPDITDTNPGVDNTLKQILSKMLSKERDHRYQSCEAIVQDLDGYLRSQQSAAGATLQVNPPGEYSRTMQLPREKTGRLSWGAALMWLFGLLLLGGSAVAGWYYVDPAGAQSRLAALLPGGDAESLVLPPLPGPGTEVADSGSGQLMSDTSPDAAPDSVSGSASGSLSGSLSASGQEDYLDDQQVNELIAQDVAVQDDQAAVVVLDPVVESQVEPNSGSASGIASASAMVSAESAMVTTPSPTPSPTLAPAPVTASVSATSLQPAVATGAATVQEVSMTAPAAVELGPPKLVVIAAGDPVVTGVVEGVLENALLTADYEVLDEQLFEQNLGGNLASIGKAVGANGADILVYVDVLEAGQRELQFYNRTEWQTIANLQVQALSLADNRKIGAPWTAQLEYVPLNARDTAEEAAAPIATALVERLQNEKSR